MINVIEAAAILETLDVPASARGWMTRRSRLIKFAEPEGHRPRQIHSRQIHSRRWRF
jgi:hypothetical protein